MLRFLLNTLRSPWQDIGKKVAVPFCRFLPAKKRSCFAVVSAAFILKMMFRNAANFSAQHHRVSGIPSSSQ